jgi:phage gp36-like protein
MFATTENLTERYDYRLIGDLCSDEQTERTIGQVLVDPKAIASIEDASGEILTNLQAGGNYSQADLEGLTGLNQSHLVRVCCDIAMALLIQRRPNRINNEIADKVSEKAKEHINRLRKGENIFGFPAKLEAGVLQVAHMSVSQIEAMNLIPDRMGRYFPDQGQRARRAF